MPMFKLLFEAVRITPSLIWPTIKKMAFVLVTLLLLGISLGMMPSSLQDNIPYVDFVLLLVAINYSIKFGWIPCSLIGVRKSIGLPIDSKKIGEECSKFRNKLWGMRLRYLIFTSIFAAMLHLTHLVLPNAFILMACLTFTFNFFNLPILFFAFPLIIVRNDDCNTAISCALNSAFIYWKEILLINFLILAWQGLSLLASTLTFSAILIGWSSALTVGLSLVLIQVLCIPLVFAFMVAYAGVLFRNAYQLKRVS